MGKSDKFREENIKAELRQKHDKEIDLLMELAENEKNDSLESLRKAHTYQISEMKKIHEDAMLDVREQERVKYQEIVEEREKEIIRLNAIMKKNRNKYEQIKELGIYVDNMSDKVKDKMSRGLSKMEEGAGLIESAKLDANRFSITIDKNDNKLIETTKE